MNRRNESLQAEINSKEQTISYLKSRAFNKPIADSHAETDSETEIVQLIEKNKSLQANTNSKQQSINRLTTENRKQADRINSLLLVATDKKSLENELKSLKQKMENQRAELKNLNTKSNQVSLLNAEIAKLKSQLDEKKKSISDADRELNTCQKKIQQLEQEIKGYGEILNDLDGSNQEIVENSNQECAICCEIFGEDRKRVAYGPCGHSMTCVECSETMQRKTTANDVRGRKRSECPICRAEIKSTIILQGIY